MLFAKCLAVWSLILVLAFANGALRELLLVPAMGRMAANVASGVLLSLAILATAFLTAPWLGPMKAARRLLVGLLWLALTLAFEFGFGLLVQHKPLSSLLEAYVFRDGNLWPLVLAVTVLAPALMLRRAGVRPQGDKP